MKTNPAGITFSFAVTLALILGGIAIAQYVPIGEKCLGGTSISVACASMGSPDCDEGDCFECSDTPVYSGRVKDCFTVQEEVSCTVDINCRDCGIRWNGECLEGQCWFEHQWGHCEGACDYCSS
jgi:hypothetical protein